MRINPHLCFDGQCREAFTIYQRVLGGALTVMLTYGESPMASQVQPQWHERIVHATLQFENMELTGADVFSPDYVKPQGFMVSVTLEGPERGRQIFEALAGDGEIRLPYEQTFWSPGFGVLVDRFGIPWEVNSLASAPESAR